MGVRMQGVPGLGGGFDKLVEQLVEAEKIPIEAAKKRRENVVAEKKEVEKLQGLLTELDTTLNGLKTESSFYKLKVESSHPDIMEGTVEGFTLLGTYEFEVRGLAKNEKELSYGFPDKDASPVGFGFMLIEREDQEPAEVIIEPDSTLNDVARQINDTNLGVRAMVINTKYDPDSYRLLVVSEDSGKEAKILIDEDTTFLEFKEQVTGRNLDVLFEDVPVTDNDNMLDELVDGVNFHVKRSEPGTRVQVSVVHDMDATVEGIQNFVSGYNSIVDFAAAQSSNPSETEPGLLSGDSSVKTVMRQLQFALFPSAMGSGSKYQTLAEVGIKTNPKTGHLEADDTQLRAALTDDYEAVANLFIHSKFGDGVGERMSKKVKAFRDPVSGVIKSRLRGLDRVIDNQDRNIVNKERTMVDKEASIKRRFSNLESQMNTLNSQGNFLAQRFGGDGSGGGGAA